MRGGKGNYNFIYHQNRHGLGVEGNYNFVYHQNRHGVGVRGTTTLSTTRIDTFLSANSMSSHGKRIPRGNFRPMGRTILACRLRPSPQDFPGPDQVLTQSPLLWSFPYRARDMLVIGHRLVLHISGREHGPCDCPISISLIPDLSGTNYLKLYACPGVVFRSCVL